MIPVTLTEQEMLLAATVGVQRQLEALRRGLPDRHGYAGDGWSIHIEGAGGELAFAKAINRHWAGTVNTFRVGGDVGEIQVRTRSRQDYDLLLRESDRDDDVFVLVTGRMPQYQVHGWIYGREGKRREWRQEYGGRPSAYFVPQVKLRPFEDKQLPPRVAA